MSYGRHSTSYSRHSTSYSRHSTSYSRHSVSYMWHSISYSRHSTSYSRHSTSYMWHSMSYSRHSMSYMWHSMSYSRHSMMGWRAHLATEARCTIFPWIPPRSSISLASLAARSGSLAAMGGASIFFAQRSRRVARSSWKGRGSFL
jgi:hypothetical protein